VRSCVRLSLAAARSSEIVMREIKFRAWDVDGELWRYFSLADAAFGKLQNISVDLQLNHICQFTGLHDKNGKEIYEHDMLDMGTENCTVVFEEGRFFPKDQHGSEWNMDYADKEIIGCIYQNQPVLTTDSDI
jgi:hypothetical protein